MSATWKVVKLWLPDPGFRNRQNGRSDFRIRRDPGSNLYVHRVAVRRAEGPAPAASP